MTLPARSCHAIIASVDQEPAPLRLLLASDAYQRTHQVLAGRLAALEAQKALAATTDVTARTDGHRGPGDHEHERHASRASQP